MRTALIHRLYARGAGLQHRLLAWPLALLAVLAIHGASAFFALQLQFNNSPEVFYPDGSPAVTLRESLRKEFPSDEVLTVVFQGKDLYSKDFLTRLDRAASLLQKHPLVDRVTTVTTMERISGSDDGFSVGRLIDPQRLKNESPESLRQRVLSDRFAPGLLASRDGTLLTLAVRPKSLSQSSERLALKVATAKAINEAGLREYFAGDAGPVTIDVAQLESIFNDTLLFVPLTALIGLALLGWVVGRWRPVAIGAVAMSTVILPVIAGLAVSGQPYTMATAILPSLLAAYTLATLLHLYSAVQRAQAGGLSRSQSVDRALAETRKPGAFNVLTTGAGLLSMVLVPIPPIRVFGVAGAVGTLLVFLVVFVLVPPFLARWDNRRWPQRSGGMKRLGRIASRITLTSMRYPKTMVLCSVVILVAMVPLAQQVKVESDPLSFFRPDHPVSRHTALIESKLAGVTSLEISLVGAGRDSLQNVATLAAIREFQGWLETQAEVDRSVSMVDMVEEMHWAMNGEKPAFRTLPGNDRLLRQYLLVYDGNDLFELVNRDFQHARIVLNLNVHGANQIGGTIDRIREHLKANPLPGVEVDIGGFGRLFADQIDSLVTGQINSFAGSFLQIFLIMALLFRSFSASAVCMLPNLAPLFFIFVLMGATGIPLDMATVMIAGVVLGITVDDTIHLYHGYRHRRLNGISPVLAIARSFASSGRAVLAISVVLTAQFALLATSDFVPTANFGLMTLFGLLSGQLAELLLLPALLVLKDVRRQPLAKKPAPVENERELADSTAWAPTRWVERKEVSPGAGTILVCMGDACQARDADGLWRGLMAERDLLDATGRGKNMLLLRTSCLGSCESAPCVQAAPNGRQLRAPGQAELLHAARQYLRADDTPEDRREGSTPVVS
jgi:predicted RND superfamily exporter protein